MAKPTFFVAGQGKSGTTLLHRVLRAHPDVFVPAAKEVSAIADEVLAYGLPYFERLHHHDYAGQPSVGDCYSATMSMPDAAERIVSLCGSEVRLVFSLRHPIDRAVAHYNMAVRQLRETEPFARAVELEAVRATRFPALAHQTAYTTRGLYARQLAPFVRALPRAQIHVLVYEEAYGERVETTARQLFAFLGVRDDLPFESPGRVNAGVSTGAPLDIPGGLRVGGKDYQAPSDDFAERARRAERLVVSAPPRATARELWASRFADDVAELEQMLGRSFDVWRARYDTA